MSVASLPRRGARAGQFLGALGALLLVLSACGGEATPDDADPPAAEEDFEDPTPEDPGATEASEEQGGGGVSVELAGLPIGGNAPVDESDPTLRCAEINWTGPPDNLPPEVNLEITGIGVNPADVYEATDGGCLSGLPACQFSPGILGTPPCGVAVQQVAPSPDGSGEVFVSSGVITCDTDNVAICEQFESDLADNPNPARITWSDGLSDLPTDPPEGESTNGEDDNGGDDSGGEDDSTGLGDEVGTTQAP